MRFSQMFKRIRLHLARSREFPSGSTYHGYEFVAPLDEAGYIDPEMWRTYAPSAVSGVSGPAKTISRVFWSTNRAAANTLVGFLTTTRAAPTTRPDTVSARINSFQVST